MFLVQCEELRINHLTPLSVVTNALRLLILVTCKLYWGLQVTSSFSNWGCILKGCFEGGIIWRAKSRLKGIEDFNLEHCPESIFAARTANLHPHRHTFRPSLPSPLQIKNCTKVQSSDTSSDWVLFNAAYISKQCWSKMWCHFNCSIYFDCKKLGTLPGRLFDQLSSLPPLKLHESKISSSDLSSKFTFSIKLD
jgi:hypothetical protein